MADESDFEILPAGEMQMKYGLYAKHRPVIRLNPNNVPIVLRHLIQMAERFGISDDLIRADFMRKVEPAEVEELHRSVVESEGPLMEWLAGPEAAGPDFTPEYLAFTNMLMAHDGC